MLLYSVLHADLKSTNIGFEYHFYTTKVEIINVEFKFFPISKRKWHNVKEGHERIEYASKGDY